jgi:hypothetical protein
MAWYGYALNSELLWKIVAIGAHFLIHIRAHKSRCCEGSGRPTPGEDIAVYFRDHPETAKDLLHESYDKRCTPSTFLEEEGDGFRVGWFSSKLERTCVKDFSNLAGAATDYLLFSLGKGRWASGRRQQG